MGESKDRQTDGKDTESEADGTGTGKLNDPLTHREVEAPRVPFEADSGS